MPSLKEIKGRIGSVKSTLKITSAMKLVASAKLRKAQNAIAALRPYERALGGIFQALGTGFKTRFSENRENPENVVIIALASNSSLCGGFNAAAVHETISAIDSYKGKVEVISIGRKMADNMKKIGYPSLKDWHGLSEHPEYNAAAEIVEDLMERFEDGKLDRVEIVYNHFISNSTQKPVREVLLPIISADPSGASAVIPGDSEESLPPDIIIEPSPEEAYMALLPKTLKLKLYAALLDSAAAEHAARTVAMQTATDNGEDLLDELTLEYNKGRQQKITSELLDIVGGTLK